MRSWISRSSAPTGGRGGGGLGGRCPVDPSRTVALDARAMGRARRGVTCLRAAVSMHISAPVSRGRPRTVSLSAASRLMRAVTFAPRRPASSAHACISMRARSSARRSSSRVSQGVGSIRRARTPAYPSLTRPRARELSPPSGNGATTPAPAPAARSARAPSGSARSATSKTRNERVGRMASPTKRGGPSLARRSGGREVPERDRHSSAAMRASSASK
jgi:hypothetical protein